jgi:hypothetical protein
VRVHGVQRQEAGALMRALDAILKTARANGWDVEDYDEANFTVVRETETVFVMFVNHRVTEASHKRLGGNTTHLGPRDIDKRKTVLGWLV